MKCVNRLTLVGVVGRDPEVKTSAKGTKYANVPLATTNKWTGADGKPHERTDWHRCTAFGRLADIVDQYVKKGDRLYVEGRCQHDKDESGTWWTSVVLNELVMLGSTKKATAGHANR